jgi:hypothetical protein
MRLAIRSSLVVAALVVSPIAQAQPAPAPSASAPAPTDAAKAQAIARFQKGMTFYEEGNHSAALVEFRAAYALSPNYKALFNIGQVCFQVRDYACALTSFESYLREGGTEVDVDRREEVERELAPLRDRVARLSVSSDVAGADVLVDDVLVGRTPLRTPLVVNAGRRKVSVSKAGLMPVSRVIELLGAGEMSLTLNLAPSESKEAPPPVQPQTERPSRMTTLAWVGVGTGGALLAGAVVTGLLAISANNKLDTMRFVGDSPSDEVDSQSTKTRTLAITTDVLAGAGLVTLGTTLVLVLTRQPQASAASPSPKVSLDLTRSGAALSGTF